MELRTERLILRPLCVQDMATYNAYAMDAETCRYMLFLPHKTEKESLAELQACEANWQKEPIAGYEMAVMLEGRHIGSVSLIPADGKAVMGWILNKACHGRGYAYEAAQALKDHAVNVLGYTCIAAYCDARNLPSQKVMKKLGMQLVREQTRTYPDERGTAAEYKYEWRR